MSHERLPVPYFEINQELDIIKMSDEAKRLFPGIQNFGEAIDEGSKNKAAVWLCAAYSGHTLELNLVDEHGLPALYQVYQTWDTSEVGQIVCICQQSGINQTAEQLKLLYKQLGRQLSTVPPEVPIMHLQHTYDNRRSESTELQGILNTIRELIHMLRPDLLEMNKSDYIDILLQQIDSAIEAADQRDER